MSELLDAAACDERVRIAGTRMGAFTPHCARVDPARLVLGLARAVERRRATVHDGTTALEVGPGRVHTDRGTIRAGTVVFRPLLGLGFGYKIGRAHV